MGLAGAVRPPMDIYESSNMIKNPYFLRLIARKHRNSVHGMADGDLLAGMAEGDAL